jgi:hypothetical protein
MHRIFKLIDFFLEMGESMRRLKKYLIGPGETKRQPCQFQTRIISVKRGLTALEICVKTLVGAKIVMFR